MPGGVPPEVWNRLPQSTRDALTARANQPTTPTTPSTQPTTQPTTQPATSGPPAGIPADAWAHMPQSTRDAILARGPNQPATPTTPTTPTTQPTSSGLPGGVPPEVWNRLPQSTRDALTARANQQQQQQGNVINPALADYLQSHPEIKTVQDFVNATYNSGKFDSTAKELGLDPAEIAKYRSANLVDWAVVRQPPAGTVPRSVDEANAYHLTQYNTAEYGTDFNRYGTNNDFSNNCGPASLAMALKVLGKLPAGLNPEQQIDYARSLITGSSNGSVTVGGQTYKLDDNDTGADALVGYGEVVNGAQNAQVPASHVYGWGNLSDAVVGGHPVVAAGTINQAWKDAFPEGGHYGSAGNVGHFIAILGKTEDGKYLVSDPMYANGAVPMTEAQLKLFVGDNPDLTVVGTEMKPGE